MPFFERGIQLFFDLLKKKITIAARKAFTEMLEKHAEENIYAFALYSDEGAMTVCPSTNTMRHFSEKANRSEAAYYKFSPAEWKYEMQGADSEFNEICDLLLQELEKISDDSGAFLQFRSRLFACCIKVLEALKNEKFFNQTAGNNIFLVFSVSDYEFETAELKNIIMRLNDDPYRSEYLDWIRSWES